MISSAGRTESEEKDLLQLCIGGVFVCREACLAPVVAQNESAVVNFGRV
jgi:hypothetical protein